MSAEPPGPYRDDRASLAAENERLRRSLAAERRQRRLWPVVALLAAHIALRAALSSWLNGSSDALFWIAVTLAYAPLPLSAVLIALALRNADHDGAASGPKPRAPFGHP